MFLKGHIYRGRKPVNWSPSSRTALAEAELEYNEKHISRSIYVGFKVTQPTAALEPYVSESDELRVVIWTTTPWTIPANLAVAVNGDLEYAVVGHPSIPYKMVVAKDLIASLATRIEGLPEGESLEEIAVFTGKEIEGSIYSHPFAGRESKVVLGGDYITTESGTGMVHTAPGHGQDDYLTGLKYGLELLSPVNDAGCFTSEAGPELEGLSVLGDGNLAVIEKLKESGESRAAPAPARRSCASQSVDPAHHPCTPAPLAPRKSVLFLANSLLYACGLQALRDHGTMYRPCPS